MGSFRLTAGTWHLHHDYNFTGRWLRQCTSRYAFHAGRNLPVKELRYLRTLIVRAAVYWGFGRQLRSEELTAFLNLPAPGRRQTLYIHLRVSSVLCF